MKLYFVYIFFLSFILKAEIVWISVGDLYPIQKIDTLKPFIGFRAINLWAISKNRALKNIKHESHYLNKLKKYEIEYSSMLGLIAIKDGEYSNDFLEKIATRNPLGDMITFNREFHHGCLAKFEWREEILDIADAVGKAGVSFIELDQPALESWRGECYCDTCMKNFRDYLKKNLSEKELKDLGIKDISKFDYRDFLINYRLKGLNKNLAELNEGDRFLYSPLGKIFFRFQIEDNIKNIKWIFDRIKKKYPNIKVFGNIWGMAGEYLPPARYFDILNVGGDIITPWDWRPSDKDIGPPKNSWILVYKFAKGFEPKKSILSFLDTNGYVRGLKCFKNHTDFLRILSSEALGCGVDFVFPVVNRVAGPQKESFSLKAIKNVITFYRKNLKLFKDANKSMAEVAIFMNYIPLIIERFSKNLWGLSYLFLNNNIDFDVLFSGNNEIFKDTINYEQLKRYKLIFIPHSDYLSEHQKNVFIEYLNKGGHVITTGNFVFNHPNCARFNVNFYDYYLNNNFKLEARFLIAIDKFYKNPRIKFDKQYKNLRVLTSVSYKSENILLVNSNYSKDKQAIIPLKNVKLRIKRSKISKVVISSPYNDHVKFKRKFHEGEIELIIPVIKDVVLIRVF